MLQSLTVRDAHAAASSPIECRAVSAGSSLGVPGLELHCRADNEDAMRLYEMLTARARDAPSLGLRDVGYRALDPLEISAGTFESNSCIY